MTPAEREWRRTHVDSLRENNRRWYAKNGARCWARLRLSAIKSRCKKSGTPFDLTVDDLEVPEHCPVLGIPLVVEVGNKVPQDYSPSVDRIDPTRGYVKGNVAVISTLANRLKSDGTIAQHERVLAWMKSVGAP